MSVSAFQISPLSVGSLTRQASRNLLQRALANVSRFVPSQRLAVPASVKPKIGALRKGNPDKGYELYRGRFELAGESVNTGAKLPFACDASDLWHAELHRFSWLGDLAVARSELQRAQARVLLSDWMANRDNHRPVAMELGVVARRLLNLLIHSGFLLEQSSSTFEEVYYEAVARHVRWLQKRFSSSPAGLSKLEAAMALSYASVCLDNGARFRDAAFQALGRELDAQIQPDGCHISRNPETLTEVLLDLLPLVELMERQRIEPQPRLCAAIDRAMPALRMLCHGDAGLVGFNGVARAMRGAVKTILERDDVAGKPVSFAVQTGYARLSHLRTNVIVDCGSPPPAPFAEKAHSGSLAFEFSEGPHRIIVSCGESPAAPESWGDAMRTTAAHSTAVLGERASARILKSRLLDRLLGGPLVLGPRRVDCNVDRHGAGTVFSGRHDGYVKAFGLLHERTLWLAADGQNLRGEDNFHPTRDRRKSGAEADFVIRFHLHPSVKATLSKDHSSAVLLLPDRSGWRFNAKGARLSLEESVYLVDRPAPQRTLQVVLSGFAAGGHSVKWALKKLEKRSKTHASAAMSPELPL